MEIILTEDVRKRLRSNKIRMENSNCPEKYIYLHLPINADELNDLMGDVLGRDTEGRVLDNQNVNWYYVSDKEEIGYLFDLNEQIVKEFGVTMPPYLYGKNEDVYTDIEVPYKGSIESTILPLIPGERHAKQPKISSMEFSR